MNQVRRALLRLVSVFRHGRAERELSREITAHLRLLEDDFVARGMSREEARYAAKREFHGVEQTKELQRDARSFRWLAGWPMDLKLGARMLVRSPGLTIVAVLALAVAIGAGAAYLEFTRDFLSPTLDMPGGERIVGIRVWNAERRAHETVRVEDFVVLRANTRAMEDLAAVRPVSRHLTTPDGRTDPARAVEVSASAFRLFPAAPLLGRTLSDDDERLDAEPVAVLGHDLWMSRFGGSHAAIGSVIRLGSSSYAIVGVMPEGFGFPVNENLWVPLKGPGPIAQIAGRMKDGAAPAAAESESAVLVPRGVPNARASVVPYLESFLGPDRGSVEIAVVRAANVIFIMLLGICGANVATLVFARTAMREPEITVRTALGAGRGRISAQLFAEALVLCLLAAAAGLLAAMIVGRWATALYVQGIGPLPFWWHEGLGYQTVLYALALAVLAALIVGVVPALKATSRPLHGRMRESASGTSTMKFGGLWTSVIVMQTAITVIVLATVVSFGWTSYRKSSGGDVIYARDRLLTAPVMIDRAGDDAGAKPADAKALQAIAERLEREPGVAGVSYTSALPGTIWEQFIFELQSAELQAGADARKLTDELWCEGARVGGRFFETVGIPLVSGRDFSAAELTRGAPVAIVDETFARSVLGGRSPLGVSIRERAREGQPPGPWLEIVGVVRDASAAERKGPDDAAVYRPAAPGQPVRLLVRTSGPAAPLSQRVYAAALDAEPDARLVQLKTVAQVADDDAMPQRMFLTAFAVIAAIALLLATAGIYALISFTLSRRTREIGIRVALGASAGRIIAGVFRRSFTQIGLGVAAGALPGLVVMLSGSDDAGAMTLPAATAATLGVCAFVIAIALLSCLVPLRRALKIQPTEALRTQ